MPDQEIENKVKQIIVDELGVDENEVTPNARFIDDLGADSLDFIDIVFGLEKQFSIKLKSAELDSLLRADFVAERPSERGFVPRAEIDRLVDWLPALRAAPDLDRILPSQLFSYVTTESLVLLVQRRLEAPN